MYNIYQELRGTFDVEFIGDPKVRRVQISDAIFDMQGHPIVLLGVEAKGATTYNWVTIIKMTKVEEQ